MWRKIGRWHFHYRSTTIVDFYGKIPNVSRTMMDIAAILRCKIMKIVDKNGNNPQKSRFILLSWRRMRRSLWDPPWLQRPMGWSLGSAGWTSGPLAPISIWIKKGPSGIFNFWWYSHDDSNAIPMMDAICFIWYSYILKIFPWFSHGIAMKR